MKKVKKLSFLIVLIFIILNISQINKIGAFLDSGLGLDLYIGLDSGLTKLEEKQYIYELRESNEKIADCFNGGITPELIEGAIEGNIQIIINNLKKEKKCGYNKKDGKFDSISSEQISNFIYEIREIRLKYKEIAEEKAKAIYEISRIGMYSDGNTDNSPFDIIKDIQDIDKIIFTEEIEYEGDESSFLSEITKSSLDNVVYNSPTNLIKKKKKDNNNIINTGKIGDSKKEDKNQESNNYLNLDGNNYVCKNDINDSGLNTDSLDALKDSLNQNSKKDLSFNFNYSSGHIKLPDSNKIDIPNLNKSNYIDSGAYSSVNDNSEWGCNSFFCIVIDFVVNNQDALSYGDTDTLSIEGIIKISNKHFKKAANTSLVQSKMATNNFEMSLRDLDLPSIFHMGIIITKKSPPILNLEEITQKKKTESNNGGNEEIKIILKEKYKNLGLNYDKANDINEFLYKDEELLGIIHSLENSATLEENLRNEFIKSLDIEGQINDYDNSTQASQINNSILEEFDLEFSELEQFTSSILDYTNDIDKLIKKLNEIPTYSG